jgi:PAS domain S-box-containing protein
VINQRAVLAVPDAEPETGTAVAILSPRPRARAGRFERRTDDGPDLVSLHAPDGLFLEASPAAFSLLGAAPEDLIGRRFEDLADHSERQRVSDWWWSLRNGRPALLVFHAKRGNDAVWLECSASPSATNGRVTQVHAITRDVTRHREHADELARRCEALERENSELEGANRDLLMLAADAAHDLRAPVQVITGFAELLAGREGARLDETSQEFLAHILAAAGSMRDLVEAVLDHSRAAKAPLELGSVDCGELLIDVLSRLQTEIDDRGAKVEIHWLPSVWGDRIQLGRVFQNLLSNAVAAVRPDCRPELVLSARRLPWQWQLMVTDNGVGIPAEDRTRIFEAFQRGEGSRGGTGLGLAICKTIVERHGGRIWVEAVPGGGSRFAFTLPADSR